MAPRRPLLYLLAGMIVWQAPDGKLHNYDVLGYVVAGSMLVMIVMMYYINRMLSSQPMPAHAPHPHREVGSVAAEG